MSQNVSNPDPTTETWLNRIDDAAHTPIRVLVIEDVLLVRRRIAAALAVEPDLSVVGEAGTCGDAQTWLMQAQADVLVCDISLPGTPELRNGIDLIVWALRREPRLRVIVLTNYADEAYRRASLRAGASAFLDKSSEFAELPAAIRAAIRGSLST